MKNITYIIFVILLAVVAKTQAQCNEVVTIEICDMTIIDYDNDGEKDGIINLYDSYNAIPGSVAPIDLTTGTWLDAKLTFALDETTGNLHLWDLEGSSEEIIQYQFQLFNSASGCPNGIVTTVNVVIGPFSGIAADATGGNNVNVQICNQGSDPCSEFTNFDLFQTFISTPTAHKNGVWTYEGVSPNFVGISDGKILHVIIPYQPGPPLVDEEIFELIYTVPGITPCSPSEETRVRVSAVREVFSGSPNHYNICETELIAGSFNTPINLRDDQFLVNEDIEGVWLIDPTDPTGQITAKDDSQINLKEVYDDLYQSNQRFECETYGYSYFVESRSTVCESKTSTVSFTIFESLRPFEQKGSQPELCVGDPSLPNNYNLNTLLEFTTENGILYNYPPKLDLTRWSLVSGPSSLNLNNNLGTIGLSNITNTEAGTYTFRYSVSSQYHCSSFLAETIHLTPDGCRSVQNPNHPCGSESALVTIIIHPKLYTGENTIGLQFCETDPAISTPLNLFSLLKTNGVDGPIYKGDLGQWIDNTTGKEITNPTAYVIPTISDLQFFDFKYETTSSNGCIDTANLSFTVFEEYQSGVNRFIDVCDDNAPFDLFNRLGGSPNTNGTWTGPDGYKTTDNVAIYDPKSSQIGIYTYTVPDNVNASGIVLCNGNSAEIAVTLHLKPNAGLGGVYSVCRSDLEIDLVDYLGSGAVLDGDFRDLDGTNLLTESLLDVSQLISGRYNFQYEYQGHGSCSLSTSLITIDILEADVPLADNQTFCVIDGATVNDLVASNGLDFNWYDTTTSTTPLSFNEVLVHEEDYFVAAVDSENCESSRVSITVTLLPLDHVDCDDCIKDGISVNGDGENDEFTLCRLPVAFPDFEINIFNRYGSKVYKGNKNTPLFNGLSNVPLTIGDRLPSGVYFYVFDPRDGVTKPFQGNFYLSI